MEVTLSNQVFEWLLAEWAGCTDNLNEFSPSLLRHVDHTKLADELDLAIRMAQNSRGKKAV